MQYEELGFITRTAAERELAKGDAKRMSVALTRLALNEPDAGRLQCLARP